LSLIIYFTDPGTNIFVVLFFIVLFLAILFTFSLIFQNSRRGLLASVVVTIFILLRFWGIGNVLNLILLVGLAVSLEIYAGFKK